MGVRTAERMTGVVLSLTLTDPMKYDGKLGGAGKPR